MNESRQLGGAIPFLVGLAVLCSAAGCAPASDPTAPGAKLHWRKSTPLPEPRAGHAAGLLDGKFVIAGGTWWEGEKGNWTQKIFSASTHAFDPETESWERLPDAPFPFGYSAYAVVENRLYVLGGFDGKQEIRKILRLSRQGDEYQWEVFGELPRTRLFGWAGSSGSSLYLLGGVERFEPTDEAGTCCTSKTATNSLSVLDTAAPDKGWRELSPYPGGKRWLFAAAGNGESFWLFGGIDIPEAGAPPVRFNQALHYDLEQDPLGGTPSLARRNPGGQAAGSASHPGEDPVHELCQNGVAARPAKPGVQPADTPARRSLRGQVCPARWPHHRRRRREQDRIFPAAVGMDLHRGVPAGVAATGKELA